MKDNKPKPFKIIIGCIALFLALPLILGLITMISNNPFIDGLKIGGMVDLILLIGIIGIT